LTWPGIDLTFQAICLYCPNGPAGSLPAGLFLWGRTAIWRIVGIDKVTNKLVEITIADNPAERRMILREERHNYDDLRAVPLRMPVCGQRAQVTA
jgi:hypothetical protein